MRPLQSLDHESQQAARMIVLDRDPVKRTGEPLSYPLGDAVPAPARSLEVAPGVHWLRMPLPFALDHITLWLLADGDGWTVVDCGLAQRTTMALWEEVFESLLGGRPIRRLVVTHCHGDHIGLAGWLARRWNAEVWMTEGEQRTASALYADAPGYD